MFGVYVQLGLLVAHLEERKKVALIDTFFAISAANGVSDDGLEPRSMIDAHIGEGSLQERLLFGLQAHEEVTAELKAQPARRHTRRHLEQVRDDTLVEPLDAFLGNDDADSVRQRFVLIPHPGHGVDLESPPENVTVSVSTPLLPDLEFFQPKTYNGYVHVCATAPEMAPAASFRTALGF